MGNVEEIERHNSNAAHTYKMGINQFTDMTGDQLAMYRGRSNNLRGLTSTFPVVHIDSIAQLPDEVDWRTKGDVITPVKNQGSCGSCWAFASTETLESHIALDTGKLLELSPQNIVSCNKNPDHCGGTGGCQGSIAELAYGYVIDNGIALEKDYPYTSGTTGMTGQCRSHPPAANVTGFVKLEENNLDAVMTALATIGPLAINVDASKWSGYRSGVYDACKKGGDIDHVVQLVGYGTDPTDGAYWLVRNSWGTSWGEDGYMKLRRHLTSDEWCGDDDTPGDGTGCTGGPDKVTICGSCGIIYDVSYPTGGQIIG